MIWTDIKVTSRIDQDQYELKLQELLEEGFLTEGMFAKLLLTKALETITTFVILLVIIVFLSQLLVMLFVQIVVF